MMRHYYSLNEYYQAKYGQKVFKLTLNAGLSCPNRDGTIGERGCIFCADGSSDFSPCASLSITDQLAQQKERIKSKTKARAFIAYFQPYSNTYGEISYLEKIYREAMADDEVVALSIATRPDCLPDEVLRLLDRINHEKPVTVELGLQTKHEATARYIRRGYDLSVYEKAVKRLKTIGVEVVTHLILGLPGESREMMLETVGYAASFSDGLKLQLLFVLEGTDLEKDYRAGKFSTLSLEEYADLVCDAIKMIPRHVVIHRLTGDGAKARLIAPLWSGDKKRVLNFINKRLDERGISQGSRAERMTGTFSPLQSK